MRLSFGICFAIAIPSFWRLQQFLVNLYNTVRQTRYSQLYSLPIVKSCKFAIFIILVILKVGFGWFFTQLLCRVVPRKYLWMSYEKSPSKTFLSAKWNFQDSCIESWIRCLSYHYEKQTSRIQSLNIDLYISAGFSGCLHCWYPPYCGMQWSHCIIQIFTFQQVFLAAGPAETIPTFESCIGKTCYDVQRR